MKTHRYFYLALTAAVVLLPAVHPAVAELDIDQLAEVDVSKVKNLLAKLEPVIRKREVAQSLATLTFDELYTDLDEPDQEFLKEFQNLNREALGVKIPFRQIATGKEKLIVISEQFIFMDGKPAELPPQYLPPNVHAAYLRMMNAMEDDIRKRLYVESGYRSSAYQLYLFIFYLKNHDYSIRETVKWVALPGYSEHGAPDFQAIDFISMDGISGETNPEEFENLAEYNWLLQNAGRFGFVLSYPRGAEGITFEPWHWRYEKKLDAAGTTDMTVQTHPSVEQPAGSQLAPDPLPYVTEEMQSADFWINRQSAPDVPILTGAGIEAFNRQVQNDLHLTFDLLASDTFTGADLTNELKMTLTEIKNKNLVTLTGTPPSEEYWPNTEALFNLENIPGTVPARYGLITRFTNQRFIPADAGLYAEAGDIDFDELQNSALDMATPVLILHSNSDGSWVYVRAAISSGWVKADDVGETTREEFETFLTAPFVVTSAALTDIFADKKLTEKLGTLRMGVRLPLVLSDADVTSVLLPIKKEDGSLKINPVFVGNDFIHEGFLAYTPRNVLSQAFKLFGRPYGWGGKELTQDCSRFIQEVFATFGFELPRDSKNQIRTGLQLAQWDEAVTDETKQAFFKNAATPGATLLGMKGHIMLYLGSIDGRAYAIHSVWAYRQSTPDGDQPVVLNRVTLSDLTLGEGSEKGSWLNRINAVRFIGASE